MSFVPSPHGTPRGLIPVYTPSTSPGTGTVPATTNRSSLPPHRSTHTVPAPMYSGNLNETAVAPKTSIEPNRNKGRIPHRLRRLRLWRRGPQSS